MSEESKSFDVKKYTFQILLRSDSALSYYADWTFKIEEDLTFNCPVKDILVFFFSLSMKSQSYSPCAKTFHMTTSTAFKY